MTPLAAHDPVGRPLPASRFHSPESWAHIHWAIDAGLIEPPSLAWGCPNNPFVVESNPASPKSRTLCDFGQAEVDSELVLIQTLDPSRLPLRELT